MLKSTALLAVLLITLSCLIGCTSSPQTTPSTLTPQDAHCCFFAEHQSNCPLRLPKSQEEQSGAYRLPEAHHLRGSCKSFQDHKNTNIRILVGSNQNYTGLSNNHNVHEFRNLTFDQLILLLQSDRYAARCIQSIWFSAISSLGHLPEHTAQRIHIQLTDCDYCKLNPIEAPPHVVILRGSAIPDSEVLLRPSIRLCADSTQDRFYGHRYGTNQFVNGLNGVTLDQLITELNSNHEHPVIVINLLHFHDLPSPPETYRHLTEHEMQTICAEINRIPRDPETSDSIN